MRPIADLADLAQLYAARGGLAYGENVSQLDHALQCAALARADGSAPELIAAALLHDVGHLFEDESGVADAVEDYRHERSGSAALTPLFGEAVSGPIALHVAAKRYLCHIDPAYEAALSAASRRSLALQGGAFDAADALRFETLAHWREAVVLRRYDDMGKRDDMPMGRFGDYLPLMEKLRR